MAKVAVRVSPAGGESVLHSMFNLTCTAGHKAFSPEPMGFVGTECNSSNANGHKCGKKLVFLSSSRAIPGPKPPRSKKLRKMRRF